MKRRTLALLGGGVLAAAGLLVPIGGGMVAGAPADGPTSSLDLSGHSADKPGESLRLLFIHHSCGGQLLADVGDERERANCILDSHPNGGGLRAALAGDGYEIHEASYGSEIGEDTDMFDWLPKFRTKMDRVLEVDLNDEKLPDGKRNQIVMFKSCYPNSEFVGLGEAPGNPEGPELTVWNAKATLTALLDEFKKQPDVLFVYLTAPPIAPYVDAQPAWKWLVKRVLGKPSPAEVVASQGAWASEFNKWVVAPDGWLKDYEGKNVVPFDYYRVLTGGSSSLSKYPTGERSDDSHPSSAGNSAAAEALVPLLNRAVRRAGLAGSASSLR